MLTWFLIPFFEEHPGAESKGENTHSDSFYSKQEDRKKTLEEKSWKEL